MLATFKTEKGKHKLRSVRVAETNLLLEYSIVMKIGMAKLSSGKWEEFLSLGWQFKPLVKEHEIGLNMPYPETEK